MAHCALFGNNAGKKLKKHLVCSIFRALIRWIKYIQRPANEFGFMDLILLRSGQQHVSRPSSCWSLIGRNRIQV
jgi:hypothetical protein